MHLCHLLLTLAQMTGRRLLIDNRACSISRLTLELIQEVLVSDLLPGNVLLTRLIDRLLSHVTACPAKLAHWGVRSHVSELSRAVHLTL